MCITLPYLTLPYLTLPYLTLPYLTLPPFTVPSTKGKALAKRSYLRLRKIGQRRGDAIMRNMCYQVMEGIYEARGTFLQEARVHHTHHGVHLRTQERRGGEQLPQKRKR